MTSVDIKTLLLSQYKGKSWTQLPTPSFLVSEPTVDSNVTKMLNRVEKMNTLFRAHVKTHKTIEGTRKQLGYDLPEYNGKKYGSIVVSTLKEIQSILEYQEKTGDKFVKDAIYGIPNVTEYTLEQSVDFSKKLERFTLMIDSLEHIDIISRFNKTRNLEKKWSVIIKIDNGTHRAGILNTEYLVEAITKALACNDVQLFGFYVHSGHSYGADSIEAAEKHLLEELEAVKTGLDQISKVEPNFDQSSLVVSVGATPTLHSLEHHLFAETNKRITEISKEIKANLELHAGNYAFCDLQQVSTGCISEENVAVSVSATVISQYPERGHPVGELLINAGCIAMSREVSRRYPGFGAVQTNYGPWAVNRVSQEHGILRPTATDAKLIPMGTPVKIWPNHSCITANSFNAYFVLDKDDVVKDVWVPWRGW